MDYNFVLKPNKTAFIYFSFLESILLTFFIGLGLIFACFFFNEFLGNLLIPIIFLII
jgi:hypothetical protein